MSRVPVNDGLGFPIRHNYSESDFHACLLAHGWHSGVENPEAYWYTIDLWFKKCWPDRYIESQDFEDDSGQMEFKLQFFSWLRMLKHVNKFDAYTGV